MKTTFTSMSVIFSLARPTAWAERKCIMISSPIDSKNIAKRHPICYNTARKDNVAMDGVSHFIIQTPQRRHYFL